MATVRSLGKPASRPSVRSTPKPLPANVGRRGAATHSLAVPLADVGVPSPYALAQVITRQRIDWDAIGDRRAVLEEIFQTPYGDLFDPQNGSPLYVGQRRQPDGSVIRRRPEFTRRKGSSDGSLDDLQGVRNLAQLVERLGSARLVDIPVRNALPGLIGVFAELGETEEARDGRWSRLFDKQLIDMLFPMRAGFHPDGFTWQDSGRFYNEAAEFFDPIQGAVGDCYFIAAMSSVAWSMPFVIADQTRATAMDNEQFTHQIGFHGPNGIEHVEVTDRVLVSGGGGQYFCRSREAGETWPAVYEKAYAKWRLNESTDFPAIPSIAGGDASMACAALTGLGDYRNWHSSFSASDILQLVQNHCSNGRTTTPMISWTFGSGAEADVAYRDANVVAGHAYSVLGWMRRREYYVEQFDPSEIVPRLQPIEWPIPTPDPLMRQRLRGNEVAAAAPMTRSGISPISIDSMFSRARSRNVDYIIVRNPWGYCEGTGPSVASGDHRAIDVDWWRTIPLGVDGVFAMEINAYHRYFAGTGGAH